MDFTATTQSLTDSGTSAPTIPCTVVSMNWNTRCVLTGPPRRCQLLVPFHVSQLGISQGLGALVIVICFTSVDGVGGGALVGLLFGFLCIGMLNPSIAISPGFFYFFLSAVVSGLRSRIIKHAHGILFFPKSPHTTPPTCPTVGGGTVHPQDIKTKPTADHTLLLQ